MKGSCGSQNLHRWKSRQVEIKGDDGGAGLEFSSEFFSKVMHDIREEITGHDVRIREIGFEKIAHSNMYARLEHA